VVTREFVTIVMPALNEEAYIANAIRSLLPETGAVDYELLVLDGGSDDATRSIVTAMSQSNPRIKLVHNEKRIQSAAMNLAARVCDQKSKYLVRADCHSVYPKGFVVSCIETLNKVGAASVVVPMRTKGRGCVQKAIAAVQNSLIGNGGSPHRNSGRSGFVDHGHHALMLRQVFLDVGGYDEQFTHNEDAELDQRIIKAGGRIFLADKLAIDYFPRSDLISLAFQYFKYGRGRADTFAKHGSWPKPRQIMPVVVLVGCCVSFAGALVVPELLAIPFGYIAGCIGWGLVNATRTRDPCLVLGGIAAVVMHNSWAAGYLSRVAQLVYLPAGKSIRADKAA